MLYTSYLSKINEIPDEANKILIVRWKPKNLDINNYILEWNNELAPSNTILATYKNGSITMNELFSKYLVELSKEPARTTIKNIIKLLDNDEDVYLICMEKELHECHRRILAEHISVLSNHKWREY